ncbi:ABC transporter ATP-binding protein [Undibacterium baiyunense]|uniref:ABC transporter ATP-binding protein n=1 Tax=Undibacterium baiyunense TaxID=2828731 RepID=A0A941I361_9BURK|nr:ABC transporter ATP-binding protein [Undibacterium baiyunense]MBR7746600.1 ABC transporter ATP-binding protein [Undibacterium baiyunense]
MNEVLISAKSLSKKFGKQQALNQIHFEIYPGRIVGLIGPNGSGKTTTLKAILGLTPFDGELSVLGFDPRKQRDALMNEVCFISDVAILPRWMRVCDAIDFVEGVHPKFNREKAERYLATTKLNPTMKVKAMSKGMVVQLHLALIMAIDAKLLILDEPTLGLDIMYRKKFYQQLLEDYFDENKTIIITTHQVEEIEHMLSDVIFIRDGKVVLQASMDEIENRFAELSVDMAKLDAAQALHPIDQRLVLGKSLMLFDGVSRIQLQQLGEMRTPAVTDLFVTMMKGVY